MEPVDRRIQKLDETLRAAAFSLAVFIVIGGPTKAADLRCTPALPVFCANVHVGCAGRTALPTLSFTVTDGGVAFEDGSRWAGAASVTDSGTVYRRENSRDWIRLDRAGAFSQRVYRKAGPVMAYGTCG